MLKKAGVLFVFLLLLGFGGYYLIKNYYHTDPETLVSLVKPKSEDKPVLEGAALPFPLSVKEGFRVGLFADLGGSMPRVLAIDPKGTLLASITSKGKVLALPDKDKDGIADSVKEVLSGLDRPHGIAFYGGKIYVAETDKVVSYDYNPDNFSATSGRTLFSLPGGGRHFSRTIKVIGDKLYTSVGSSCDTCIEKDEKRAALLVSGVDGSNLRVYAKGLRNTVFFVEGPDKKIWGTDMGRDFLGDTLPPDDINIIEDGKDYGWPYCYGAGIRDFKFENGEKLEYCNSSTPPVFELPAHNAPLGLVFMGNDLLVSLHGSWNSSVPVGYKVVKLTLKGGKLGAMEDFLTGFIKGKEVMGRPVDLTVDGSGNLFISDDKAGLIYIVSRVK